MGNVSAEESQGLHSHNCTFAQEAWKWSNTIMREGGRVLNIKITELPEYSMLVAECRERRSSCMEVCTVHVVQFSTEAHWGRAHFQIIYFRICSLPNCTTSKVYHFQIVKLCYILFRGRGGLGARRARL